MASYIDINNKLDWAMPFQRTGKFPLDRSSMFASKADADKYAKGDGTDERQLGGTSYVGQIITVYENGSVNVYTIQEDKTLKEIGSVEGVEGDLSAEIAARKAVTGINANTYQAHSDGEYINGATSMHDADILLDHAIRDIAQGLDRVESEYKAADTKINQTVSALDTAYKAADIALGERIDSVEQSITANTVIAGDGINVADEGGKKVSIKLDTSDKVLTLGTSGLLSNISLKYIQKGDSTPAKIQLIGKNSTVISEIDASDFVMDGMLENVELDGNNLKFTFNTDSGQDVITVDLSKYIDVYSSGNGIEISGKTISIKRDSTSETFFTVGANGIKLSGVQDAINAAKSETGNYTINAKKISTNPTLNGGDIQLTGYSSIPDVSQQDISDTTNINTAIKILQYLIGEVTSQSAKINLNLGFNSNSSYQPTNGGLSGKNVTQAIDYIANNYDTLNTKVTQIQSTLEWVEL